MALGKIKRQVALINAYQKGISEGIIRKQVMDNKQVVLFVKPGADSIYREAASEYRNWEVWGLAAVGALQGTAIFALIAILINVLSTDI
jgi:uncharacterized protein